jgi:hypothetical protein
VSGYDQNGTHVAGGVCGERFQLSCRHCGSGFYLELPLVYLKGSISEPESARYCYAEAGGSVADIPRREPKSLDCPIRK